MATEAKITIEWPIKYKGQSKTLTATLKVDDIANVRKRDWGDLIEDSMKPFEAEFVNDIEAALKRQKELEG